MFDAAAVADYVLRAKGTMLVSFDLVELQWKFPKRT